MDASLSEEQRLLQETLAQLAADLGPEGPAELPGEGPDADGWRQLADLDLLGLRVPETRGGLGADCADAGLCAEQLSRFCVALPFLGSALWATEWLVAAGAEDALLGALAGGELRLAPVLDPSLRRLAGPGEAGVAWDARGASAGLVLDPVERRLHSVALGDERLGAVDLTRELRPVSAQASVLELGDLGRPLEADAAERALARSLALLAADLVGSMQASVDEAVAHVSQREQFGVPIGSFQAIAHLAAEAHVSLEAARGSVWYALWAVDALPPPEALLAARTAKAYCAEHGREVCETQIQLFGGVGMTWEYMAHVRLRRALLTRETLGDEHFQFDAIADARLGPVAA